MASANLDLVGSICAAWRHGDYSAIGGLCIELDEYHELEGERVLVLWEFRGVAGPADWRPHRCGGTGAYLFHIRDRKVSRLAYYVDRERALADLAVAPDAGSRRS